MHANHPSVLIHMAKTALLGWQPAHHPAKCKESRQARWAPADGAAQGRCRRHDWARSVRWRNQCSRVPSFGQVRRQGLAR